MNRASLWQCPRCNAEAQKHGKGDCAGGRHGCEGLICDCDGDQAAEHGETLTDVCFNAVCTHCDWTGRLPAAANGKGWPSWAKKALLAGWKPPPGWQPDR